MIEIRLTQGKVAVVDDVDSDLAIRDWAAMASLYTWYARAGSVYLHRVIGSRIGIIGDVDHRDRDGLNCRRENLRAATHAQNMTNRRMQKNNKSGFRGVSRWGKIWQAHIQANGRQHNLGRFESPDLAARAYDRAARVLHGEFAVLNFPS